MSPDHHPAGSTPARPLRAVNASLHSIVAGMRPVLQDEGRNYFRFANGQVRRQIGRGHSRIERKARREARRARRQAVKRGDVLWDISGPATAQMVRAAFAARSAR